MEKNKYFCICHLPISKMADEENNPGADVNVFILNVASTDITTSNAESTVSGEKKIEELHCKETLQWKN
jgi:hypothetical protein